MARRSTTPQAEGRGRRETGRANRRPEGPTDGAKVYDARGRRPRQERTSVPTGGREGRRLVRRSTTPQAEGRGRRERPPGAIVAGAASGCGLAAGSSGLAGAFELREVGRRVRAARGRSARSSCAISVVGRRGLGEDAPWTPRACGRWPLEESSWSLGECGQPAPATSSLATRCCRRRLSKRCGQPVPLPCPRRAGRATGTGYPRRGTLPTPALTTGGATSDDPAGRRKRTVQPRRWLAPSCLAPEAPGSALTRRTRHEYYAESR